MPAVGIIGDQAVDENDNNNILIDNQNVVNQRRRRGRIPARFIEPNFPVHVTNRHEWPRTNNKTRNSFLCNDPDYIMEIRLDPVDNKIKYACGWKNSKHFQWLSTEEVRGKYPRLLIDFYQRPKEFCDNNI